MRKLVLGFALIAVLAMGAGITITETTRVVILPGKVFQGWRESDVDFLISILEEKMTELGRFEVYSRQNLKEILKERNLADLGITEAQAFEIGKIASAKYAILLTLNELRTGCKKANQCWASARLSVKLLDISDGKVLGTKAISTKTFSIAEDTEEAKNMLFERVGLDFIKIMKEFFKVSAFVYEVRNDGKAVLRGLDPEIVKKGMIFLLEDDEGNEGYVRVLKKTKDGVIAEKLYGVVKEGMEATELPTVGIFGDIHLSVLGPFFGLGANTWKDALSVSADYLIGSISGYTPFLAKISLRFEPLRFDRVFLEIFGGIGIIGLYDMDEQKIAGMIYGASVGGGIRYEFNPLSGIRISYEKDFFIGFEGFDTITIGYFTGF